MSKAAQIGQSDATTWMNENPRSSWAATIRAGTLGADEALINALGVNEAAQLLGVQRPYVNGELTKKAYEAFRTYARAWAATVERALKSGSKGVHATKKTGLVTVEMMPEYLKGAHRAARNWGVYPHNGAFRERVSREEADKIVAADPDGYAHIVGAR